MDTNQHQVLALLMMRFGLNPYVAIPLAKKWLQHHHPAF